MYKIDSKQKYSVDNHIAALHDYDVDVKANQLYLVGAGDYVDELGTAEPGVEHIMASRFIMNMNFLMRANPNQAILIHMKTCFSRKTLILTDKGHKKIVDIKIGDMVLTHKNRYKKVIDTMSQMYDGDMVTLYYGRNKHHGTSIRATADHPILVERNNVKQWVSFKNVLENDIIFIESGKCEFTGEKVPFWRRKKNYNCDRLRRKGKGSQQDHLEKDILPFCDKLEKDGWKVVPVGAGVIPDIIGIKDNKIVAFEVEKMTGKSLEVKKEKYHNAKIMDYVDEVVWYNPEGRVIDTFYTWYELDEETNFIKVKVTGKCVDKNKYKQRVYNITVEEDNSYVANHVVVHNCGGDWTEGMAIHNMIKSCPTPVTILSYTHARSMSSLIFQAANKRVMMPDSYFMFHDGTYAVEGTVKQVKSVIEFDKRTEKRMLEIYIESMKRSGKFKDKSEKWIEKMLIEHMNQKEDVYLTAKETVEWGLADDIFGETMPYDWGKLTEYTKEQSERG